ncbi:RNA 2',3'-cyclic phosphodiesterase [Ruegeria arenilitoris]|uniref:RNA 2',3'-cyclic phosphodiesterase n=1 Tax=Ruegeria arenilitoris TaxID=1173585 RepID=UPI00147E45E9|nr:RNA 2',3'-cyclic phosphodiesterase [Ruegeria arenilitoris]
MSGALIRCFVAIPVSSEIAQICADVARAANCGRSLPAENLHLTLAFLGDQTRNALIELNDHFEVLRRPAISVRLSGLGSFGISLHMVVEPDPGLLHLHESVLQCIGRAGLTLQRRRFRPHITIVRGIESALNKAILHIPVPQTTMVVTQFNLNSSTLRPDGARYETLSTYPLQLQGWSGQADDFTDR